MAEVALLTVCERTGMKTKQRLRLCEAFKIGMILFSINFMHATSLMEAKNICNGHRCIRGTCKNVSTDPIPNSYANHRAAEWRWQCVCEEGWRGDNCDICHGRVYLNSTRGTITDGGGNYTLDTKCSWLVGGATAGVPIRLRLEKFATECSWDHLYVFDGDSYKAPLLAVFSGLVRTGDSEAPPSIVEVTARSGSAFLHFFSDAAYNMSGFNITYTLGGCPLDCSGRGQCLRAGRCVCQPGWHGDGCQTPVCPAACRHHGTCDPAAAAAVGGTCVCDVGYSGVDCSVPDDQGHWAPLAGFGGHAGAGGGGRAGRASHASVVQRQYIWVVSGYNFGIEPTDDLLRFNIRLGRWDVIKPTSSMNPIPRYGHSVVLYEDRLYMYGGLVEGSTISDELWQYDISTGVWTPIDPTLAAAVYGSSRHLAAVGHTAHVVGRTMYVVFGHSPQYGYLNTVQECELEKFVWSIPAAGGAIVKGGYGHTSVYDGESRRIYVHGGYHSGNQSSYYLSDRLYSYEPARRYWRILRSSGQFRYLHSAVLIDRMMFVFGGNTHNDTSMSHGAKCYSNDFMAYDIVCDRWYSLPAPSLSRDISRFGHSAVADDKMYVFAGFNGVMLSDLYVYTPGSCGSRRTRAACLARAGGVRCVWADNARCLLPADARRRRAQKNIERYTPDSAASCPAADADAKRVCPEQRLCSSCVETSSGCVWCDGQCTAHCNGRRRASRVSDCHARFNASSVACSLLHNCHACHTDASCLWLDSGDVCTYSGGAAAPGGGGGYRRCAPSCADLTSCANCTRAKCMWCSNMERCVESNSYVASFPYGQCMEWTTMPSKCSATRCSELLNCSGCQLNPACGWCEAAASTGRGECLDGSAGGATAVGAVCPAPRWFFTGCPLCQCNGHSTCTEGTNHCIDCQPLITGRRCEYCREGYWGSALNGHNCTACECGDKADICDGATGSCFCHTRGVIGDRCNVCDESHKYFSSTNTGGSCYYDLTTDYQFTFNLSKDEDRFYTRINFMNIPAKSDRDVDFFINCTSRALINITFTSKSEPVEKAAIVNLECRHFEQKFSHTQHVFGKQQNTTFYVYVSEFATPFELKISFSQFPRLDLVNFFITFFSCFLSLLLLAAIFWKLKQKFDIHQREQRMYEERKQRASRPSASCLIDVSGPYCSLQESKQPPDLWGSHRRKKSCRPSPVALEPLASSRAAVLTLLLQLPTADDQFTPPGQSGIIFGSALVTLGSNRKLSLEHMKRARRAGPAHGPAENCV